MLINLKQAHGDDEKVKKSLHGFPVHGQSGYNNRGRPWRDYQLYIVIQLQLVMRVDISLQRKGSYDGIYPNFECDQLTSLPIDVCNYIGGNDQLCATLVNNYCFIHVAH